LTFDTWRFNIVDTGTFTVDVAAYEASQSSDDRLQSRSLLETSLDNTWLAIGEESI